MNRAPGVAVAGGVPALTSWATGDESNRSSDTHEHNGSWTLADWNSALVDAVFLNPSRSRPTLSRIDTTGRLFGQVCRSNDHAGSKAKFIATFGRDLSSIRAQFRWSPSIKTLTAKNGIPPTFAALYLSLLAASGDDLTHAEGNFRLRLAALLQIGPEHTIDLSGLPAIWRHFSEWSRSRSESRGDCSRLVLPDPQSETLIGHSKRLAFPTYKDETRLRAILRDSRLDSRAGFKNVNAAVHSRLSLFSASFREELSAFNTLVTGGRNQDAFDTPFWGAVRDITLDEEEQVSRKHGRFCLQLDTSDPQCPELFLLLDDVGAGVLGQRSSRRLPRPRGEYTHAWTADGADASIEALLALAGRHRQLGEAKIGRGLAAGVLALFPDALGSTASDGEFVDAGPAVFMLREDTAQLLESISRHLGLKWDEARDARVLGPWRVFSFGSLSQACLARFSRVLPDGSITIVDSWTPPQPRLAGAARFGQAVFLNPASNPFVRMDGAISGRFQLLKDDGDQVAAGALVECDEGFYIPPRQLVSISGLMVCRYVLSQGPGSREARLEVPVVSEAPTGIPRSIQREAWLVDGAFGTLAGLDEEGDSERSRHVGHPRSGPILGKWPLLSNANVPSMANCAKGALDALPAPLAWISEALLLRYQRRSVLPFAELRGHIRMASEASGIAAWKLERALFAASWLQAIESRLVPFAQVAPADREISLRTERGQVIARIVGMLSAHEQQVLQDLLQEGESASRTSTGDLQLAVGCIELRISSTERADVFAGGLGLRRVRRESLGNPLGGMLHPCSRVQLIPNIAAETPVQRWNALRYAWEDVAASREVLAGTLLKAVGRQRTTYWIRTHDGYLLTDSRTWARLLALWASGEAIGELATNGDASWSPALRSLPSELRKWWLHWGGGCVVIGEQGQLIFAGSQDRLVWEGVAVFRERAVTPGAKSDSALERRVLALALRRGDLGRSRRLHEARGGK